jgi:hypothetical protein
VPVTFERAFAEMLRPFRLTIQKPSHYATMLVCVVVFWLMFGLFVPLAADIQATLPASMAIAAIFIFFHH